MTGLLCGAKTSARNSRGVVGAQCRLRVLTLTHDCWYLFDLPELETPIEADEVVVLVGLENTPRIVPEPGRAPERPPALNALNIMREAIHTRIPVPLMVWCLPFVFDALMEHAPDFFDHFQQTSPSPRQLPLHFLFFPFFFFFFVLAVEGPSPKELRRRHRCSAATQPPSSCVQPHFMLRTSSEYKP